jgi:DNA-binding NtrC family response regulator
VVRRYAESTDTLLDIIREQPRPHEPVVAAMLALRTAVDRDNAFKMQAIRQAETVDLAGADVNLLALFETLWVDVAICMGRIEEAEIVLRRVRSMTGTHPIPEIEAYGLSCEAVILAHRGMKTEAESCLRKTLKVLPATAPRRPSFLVNFARFLAHVGRETEIDREVAEVAAKDSAALNASDASLARFIQFVETCRLCEAEEIAAQIVPDSKQMSRHLLTFRSYQELLAFLTSTCATGGRQLPTEPAGRDRAFNSTDPLYSILLALLRHAPEDALRLARQYEREFPGNHAETANFMAFNLLRAELACGNVEAARCIMARRRELGNLHYLDHLFAVRVELLSGNFDAAVHRFAAVDKACKRYRANARFDFELRLSCELSPDTVMRLARTSAEIKEGEVDLRPIPAQAAAGIRLVGSSPAMETLRATIRQMAPLNPPVLITGETGTGKDLVARGLHEESPRKGHPFIAVNCGAISETLLESELFGHARGAFTGAERKHRGIFEEAANGTVLLDEIGETPPRLQTALLRVLEGGEIRPVGSSRPRRVACRIVAATNASLAALVDAGRFRQDLFYRLQCLGILVPLLRERGNDVVELASHFLVEGRHDGRQPEMSAGLKQALLRHTWPGNVRELRNVIERMRVMGSDKLAYDVPDLELTPFGGRGADAPIADRGDGGEERTPAAALLRGERTLLLRLTRLRELFRERGRLRAVEAVRLLGVSPPTITRDLQSLCAEGLIEKVTPKASPRTHYFRLRGLEP